MLTIAHRLRTVMDSNRIVSRVTFLAGLVRV